MKQARPAKVPVVMQMEVVECGAASLAMILAYFGKWMPLEQVRTDCGVSRDGSKAKNILRAARNYGLQADGYRLGLDKLRQAPMPCIIHWNFNHFVVLRGFSKKKAFLNDPGRGAVEVPMEEFDSAYTGICLQFAPTDAFEKGGKPKSVLEFAAQRLRGTALPFCFVAAAGVLTTIVGVIYPAFGRVFLDRLLPGVDPAWTAPFFIGMLGLTVLNAAVLSVNAVYTLKINGKLGVVASSRFMWHVLRLPMEFFSQRMAGDLVLRQKSNEMVARTLISELAPVLMNLLMLVFYLVVMLHYSVPLALVGVGTSLLNLWVAQVVSKKRVNITRVQMRDMGKLAGETVAGIKMIETIKASGQEDGWFERWSGYQAAVNTAKVKFARLNHSIGAIPELIQAAANISVLLLGALMVLRGGFTTGMLLAFQGFLGAFLGPVNNLLKVGQQMQEMRTNMERIQDVMEYAPDVKYAPADETVEYAKLSGAVELRHVTFGYSPLDEPLVRDFDLKLEPGARVALVGASGCGKSTLSKLISGLYEPWSGEILFDGRPRKDIPREVLTGSLSVIDQEITLFDDTIANNIKMWDASIEDFEMIMAARDAQIHDDILQREGGYHYRILEGGRDFSGGQRQRLEIARVLAQDPTVIILDEATSALDAKTEFEVVKAIKARGITCIIVAHRLSTIRDCDEIIVLDHGRVAERGTHEELYAKGGVYTQLVTSE